MYKIKQCILLVGMIIVTQVNAFVSEVQQDSVAAYRLQVKQRHAREIIVLVHGLMRTSLSMWPLKNFLKRKGYDVYSYSYPSPRYNIQQHGVFLNQYIKHLLAENPGVKVSLITHSLGGIIAREALFRLSQKQLENMSCLIMLAPPNQGSKLAKLSTRMFPILRFAIKPLIDLSSDGSSYVHYVPVPNIKIGIIAGRYDGKVPPEYARLIGQEEPVIVNSNHTFIMNNTKTREFILNFLEKRSFDS